MRLLAIAIALWIIACELGDLVDILRKVYP